MCVSMCQQELERELEGSRLAVRALASQRAALANEVGNAEGQAAAAQRRIPELEADKKAAAAARVSSRCMSNTEGRVFCASTNLQS